MFKVEVDKKDFVNVQHKFLGKCRKYVGKDQILLSLFKKYAFIGKEIKSRADIKGLNDLNGSLYGHAELKWSNLFIGGILNDIETYLYFDVTYNEIYSIDVRLDVDACIMKCSIVSAMADPASGGKYFVITDMLYYEGQDIRSKLFTTRYELMTLIHMSSESYTIDIVEPIPINMIKSYINHYIQKIPYCQYINKILIDNDTSTTQAYYRIRNRDIKPDHIMKSEDIFKIKWNSETSNYDLYYTTNVFGEIYHSSISPVLIGTKFKSHTDSKIICHYIDSRWIPIKVLTI